MKSFSTSHIIPVLATLVLSVLSACSTGIEGTRQIQLTKADKKELLPSAEESLISTLKISKVADWKPGKIMTVAASRAAYLIKKENMLPVDSADIKDKKLRFVEIISKMNPGGEQELYIKFRLDDQSVLYNPGIAQRNTLLSKFSTELPMLIDPEMVENADSLLCGRELWTLGREHYDMTGNMFTGDKFERVHVDSVVTGNMLSPIKLYFTDGKGSPSFNYINISSPDRKISESRTFPQLFSLTDPKLHHSGVSDEVWTLIKRGLVREGMTKEECRLALGNPSEVDSGQNWTNVLDIWRYKDGTYLHFVDGLLHDFRQ